MLYYFNSTNENSVEQMCSQLTNLLETEEAFLHPIIVMCIGSDRSTGDSLGPMIGYKLQKFHYKDVYIYGSLSEPIHATNLSNAIDFIYKTYNNPYIIAIDASLGKPEHIGYITLGTGPLKPGLGVKKELPEIGNVHITGIVNSMSEMDSILLQTTRLSSIMTIADFITTALIDTLCRNFRVNTEPYMLQAPDQPYLQLPSSYRRAFLEAYPSS